LHFGAVLDSTRSRMAAQFKWRRFSRQRGMHETSGGDQQSRESNRSGWQLAAHQRLISAGVLKAHFVIGSVTLTTHGVSRRRSKWNGPCACGAPAECCSLNRFRGTEVSGDAHEEGSGGGGGSGERWNYASVHLTESSDESNRAGPTETEWARTVGPQ